MRLKFIKEEGFPNMYNIEEDFKDTKTCFHEKLGFLMLCEGKYDFHISEDYTGIVSMGELQQIIDFVKSMEDKRD